MSRISKDEHQNIFLEEGDTVIFSSKVIPGNETSIMKVQNSLRERNINIITETDKFVHVSGHPHREELKKMYSWIKPSIVIPVHGEYHHLKGNIEVAKECGIKKGLILKNGLLVKLAPDKPKVLGSVTTGKLILDGKNIIPLNEEAIKHRKKMLYNGTLLISLAIDIKKKISELIGMHESTISRCTNNKFVQTPRGTFKLKYFFSSELSTNLGGMISSKAIKSMLEKIILNEDNRSPLSDSQIATNFSKNGINIARRTITKYREMLSIPASNIRKKETKVNDFS